MAEPTPLPPLDRLRLVAEAASDYARAKRRANMPGLAWSDAVWSLTKATMRLGSLIGDEPNPPALRPPVQVLGPADAIAGDAVGSFNAIHQAFRRLLRHRGARLEPGVFLPVAIPLDDREPGDHLDDDGLAELEIIEVHAPELARLVEMMRQAQPRRGEAEIPAAAPRHEPFARRAEYVHRLAQDPDLGWLAIAAMADAVADSSGWQKYAGLKDPGDSAAKDARSVGKVPNRTRKGRPPRRRRNAD